MPQLVMFIGLIVVMYFFMIKPNKKRQKEMMDLRNNLKVGDVVITIGGIKGTVISVTDTDIVLETSDNKTKIEFIKSAVHTVVNKSDEEIASEDEETTSVEDMESDEEITE